MAIKRFRVEKGSGTGLHRNQGVPRDKANVEAEVDETMLTKGNHSNRKELVGIGGNKHSGGGTPLAVPEGTAIFSDRLKITNPIILKFFNESGKKGKTFAQISKKYDLSGYQETLDSDNSDKITRESQEKNIENGNFKLSALFAAQEFHEKKGSPEELSEHFIPFFERMGISPEELFGTQGQEQGGPQFQELEERELGGVVLPKAPHGGEHREPGEGPDYPIKDAYTKVGFDRLNMRLSQAGLPALDPKYIGNKSVINKAAGEYQRAFNANPELTSDYMLNRDGDPDKSDRPNNKMQRALKAKGFKPVNGKDFTNEDLQELFDEGKVDQSFIAGNFEDDLWTYRAAYTGIKDVSQEEYAEIQKDLQKNGIQASDGNIYRWMGKDLYEAYRVKPDGTLERVEPDPKVIDEIHEWDVQHIDENGEIPENMDFRWDHKRALSQARKNKNKIPKLKPFTALPDDQFVDQAYFNPDQALAQVESMVQGQGQKQAMHAGPQGQLANFLAGQQFDVVSKILSDYEDKNVAAYNRESLTNTQIANRSSERLANAITGQHDKTVTLEQSYANARKLADNNIAENEIAMWTERKNRKNLEATIGEQFRTDPNTGLHTFVKGKDLYPESTNTADIANTFSDLKRRLPGVSDTELNKMAMAMHSGKYEVQQTGNTPPNEEQYTY